MQLSGWVRLGPTPDTTGERVGGPCVGRGAYVKSLELLAAGGHSDLTQPRGADSIYPPREGGGRGEGRRKGLVHDHPAVLTPQIQFSCFRFLLY